VADQDLDLSIVIPILNEEASVEELSRRVMETLKPLNLDYEVLFVDDGSTDGTLSRIRGLNQKDPRIKALSFNRNFGKAYAYSAGFDEAGGKVVVTMDGDLQDAPEEIPAFLEKLREGYDLVTGWKFQGKGRASRALPSRLFNWVTAPSMRVRVHDSNCPFKAYRREVVKSLRIYGELYRFIPALAYWKGFRVTEIKVGNYPRKHGRSKYGMERFFKGFLDFMTVLFLTRYVRRPLHFFGLFGLLTLGVGFAMDLWITVAGIWAGRVGHQALLLLGLVLILLGTQFIFTGLLGEMVYSVKGREKDYVIACRIG
jgi:glycosyltransferase involved in cell wall biosynthesis